jgi:RNA ligase (TIGR02306 family)
VQRKLASIQVIDTLAPIAGADAIDQARVMGWTVVVKKGEFSPGDRCVFFEIDSILPDGASWAEFMRARGFRIRTLKLRGVLSQGLAPPVAILGDGETPAVGADVTELLGIRKFEAILPDTREVAGPFPALVPKTDEIRLQSALGVLDEIRGVDHFVTTKLDGTSTTYFRDLDGAFVACSRNWALTRGENAAWRAALALDLPSRLPEGIAVQGELCGPGIQKNRLGLSNVEWFCFSVYDARASRFLGFDEFMAFCTEHQLATVPIERVVRGEAAARCEHTLDAWLEASRGLYAGTKNRKEGIVVRPVVETQSTTLAGRLSFKVINNEFLLKDED